MRVGKAVIGVVNVERDAWQTLQRIADGIEQRQRYVMVVIARMEDRRTRNSRSFVQEIVYLGAVIDHRRIGI